MGRGSPGSTLLLALSPVDFMALGSSLSLSGPVFPCVNLVEGNGREECWCLLCESKFGKEKRLAKKKEILPYYFLVCFLQLRAADSIARLAEKLGSSTY